MEIPIGFIDKARFVRVIFTDVEQEYDALLRFMTVCFDWVWRRRMYARMELGEDVTVLDLACGTGLVSFELADLIRDGGLVVGLDLSPAMLRVAKRKQRGWHGSGGIDFVRATGEFIPFRVGAFRYVTVGLALRNFGDRMAVFREALRVLTNGGWFLSVDFVIPRNGVVWRLYRFHIFHVLPVLGGLVSGYWRRTLIYLANSISKSSGADEICEALRQTGFRRRLSEKMTLGVVALVRGQK